jgi:hypothetical protein
MSSPNPAHLRAAHERRHQLALAGMYEMRRPGPAGDVWVPIGRKFAEAERAAGRPVYRYSKRGGPYGSLDPEHFGPVEVWFD